MGEKSILSENLLCLSVKAGLFLGLISAAVTPVPATSTSKMRHQSRGESGLVFDRIEDASPLGFRYHGGFNVP